jgi:hypothetical protein
MNRKQAEREYANALQVLRTAEDISEQAYEAAKIALANARTNLIAAESDQPTTAEVKKENNIMRLRNRGLDC